MFSLKNVMRSNSASCLLFGTLFSVYPNDVANFLSNSSPAPKMLIFSLGLILVLNGLHLLWASQYHRQNQRLILYFSMGDFLWVIGSILLIFSGLWITSTEGKLASTFVAVLVGLFGAFQLGARSRLLAQQRNDNE